MPFMPEEETLFIPETEKPFEPETETPFEPEAETSQSAWDFESSMPNHLQELVRATGSPPTATNNLLCKETYALSFGRTGPRYSYYLRRSKEALTSTFYRCIKVTGQWLGVIVVSGPSVLNPVIISRTIFSKSGGTSSYLPWHGEMPPTAKVDYSLEIMRELLGTAPSSAASRENSTLGAPTRAKRAYIEVESDFEETSDTVSATRVVRARTSTSTRASEDLDQQDAYHQASSADVGVQFMNKEGIIVRQRPWSECDSVRALFVQAAVAKVIKPRDALAALSIRVLDREVLIVKGDDRDFQALQNILESAVTVKHEDSEQQTEFDIQVYALEDN